MHHLARAAQTHRIETHLLRPHIALAVVNDSMRRLFSSVLVGDGNVVIEFSNGDALYRYIDPSAGRLEPSLILADVQLPGCSGLQILDRIRAWGWTVPFILMTSVSDERTQRVVRSARGAYLFRTPLDIDDLRTAVMHCLGRRIS